MLLQSAISSLILVIWLTFPDSIAKHWQYFYRLFSLLIGCFAFFNKSDTLFCYSTCQVLLLMLVPISHKLAINNKTSAAAYCNCSALSGLASQSVREAPCLVQYLSSGNQFCKPHRNTNAGKGCHHLSIQHRLWQLLKLILKNF